MFSEKGNIDLVVGDDLFMIGLFVDHEGKEKNNPMARFDNLSMLSDAQIPVVVNGTAQEVHIADMRSRSGFSSSPVFMYRTFGSSLDSRAEEQVEIDVVPIIRRLKTGKSGVLEIGPVATKIFPTTKFCLLGIHCSQFSEKWNLKNLEMMRQETEVNYFVTHKTYIDGVSGMTCVVPAWIIKETLMLHKLIDQDAIAEAAWLNKHRS